MYQKVPEIFTVYTQEKRTYIYTPGFLVRNTDFFVMGSLPGNHLLFFLNLYRFRNFQLKNQFVFCPINQKLSVLPFYARKEQIVNYSCKNCLVKLIRSSFGSSYIQVADFSNANISSGLNRRIRRLILMIFIEIIVRVLDYFDQWEKILE